MSFVTALREGGKPDFLHDLEGEINGGGKFGVEVDQEVEERRKLVPRYVCMFGA